MTESCLRLSRRLLSARVWMLSLAWLLTVAVSGAAEPDGARTGIDVLQQNQFAALAGRRVGLITNHTGRNHAGVSTVQLLHDAKDVELVALFSPEHGFEGKLDVSRIADASDQSTGLKIYSLYGETRRPTQEMLADIDTLVFDIQDIGARFYTYISTMGEAMHAAAEFDVDFVVLDRPDPINAVQIAGPMLDAGQESFVGFHSLPVRHGMTIGELAGMFRQELQLDVDLQVIPCTGWQRSQDWSDTGLLWVNPSPNMRSLTQALLYPGIGLLETTNISVGRGTDTPFEVIGAPWINARQLAFALNSEAPPGVDFIPIEFTPDSSKFADEQCGGVNIVITDQETFEPLLTGFHLAAKLRQLYPDKWEAKQMMRLLGNAATLDAILAGSSAVQIQQVAEQGVDEYRKRRQQFLLYK